MILSEDTLLTFYLWTSGTGANVDLRMAYVIIVYCAVIHTTGNRE